MVDYGIRADLFCTSIRDLLKLRETFSGATRHLVREKCKSD